MTEKEDYEDLHLSDLLKVWLLENYKDFQTIKDNNVTLQLLRIKDDISVEIKITKLFNSKLELCIRRPEDNQLLYFTTYVIENDKIKPMGKSKLEDGSEEIFAYDSSFLSRLKSEIDQTFSTAESRNSLFISDRKKNDE